MSQRSISISSLLTEGDEDTNASNVIFQTQPRLQKSALVDQYPINNNINHNNKLQGEKLPELLNPLVEAKPAPTIHRNRMSLSTMINTESKPNIEITTQKIMVHDLLVQEKYPETVDNDLLAQEKYPETPTVTTNQSEVLSTSTATTAITGTITPKKRAPRGKNKAKSTNSTPSLPSNSVFLPPTITNINELDSETPQPPPIISINIQLSTHNDAHTEHNFMKLCEDKYGLNVLNPTGKLTIDLDDFNDDLDDEELDNEDTELDREEEPDNGPGHVGEVDNDILKALNLKFKSGMSDEEKETLILKELHRRKMANNKRIGKYDVHDPFIDDEELLFEEETKNNKNGWFVYYGNLLDDDVSVSKKRRHSVVEISVSDSTTTKKKKIASADSVGRTTQNSGRRRLNKEQDVVVTDAEKYKEKETVKEKGKEQISEKDKEENKDKIKRKEKEEEKKDGKATVKSKPSSEKDNNKPEEDKTLEPIVQSGPVVASSTTSNNKIIIGSFPSFG